MEQKQEPTRIELRAGWHFIPLGVPELDMWKLIIPNTRDTGLAFTGDFAREQSAAMQSASPSCALREALAYNRKVIQLVHDACEEHEKGIQEQLAVCLANTDKALAQAPVPMPVSGDQLPKAEKVWQEIMDKCVSAGADIHEDLAIEIIANALTMPVSEEAGEIAERIRNEACRIEGGTLRVNNHTVTTIIATAQHAATLKGVKAGLEAAAKEIEPDHPRTDWSDMAKHSHQLACIIRHIDPQTIANKAGGE